jgi:transcriptional regulator with XRE-family HTH domain
MERDIRIDWEAITAEARQRREARGMTQGRLAVLAKVSRSTLSRFENKSGDVQLSSVLRILSVLDMLERKIEGAILVRRKEDGSFSVSFAPNFGGGALESKAIAGRDALSKFLAELGISDEASGHAFLELEQAGLASVPRVLLSAVRLRQHWPIQFGPGTVT